MLICSWEPRARVIDVPLTSSHVWLLERFTTNGITLDCRLYAQSNLEIVALSFQISRVKNNTSPVTRNGDNDKHFISKNYILTNL